jgi:predicted RNA methylase
MNQKGLKRNTIDKFYTKPDVATMCIEHIRQHVNIDGDLVIEPSAGNGAFIEGIKSLTNHYRFYDIEPDHAEIKKQDYLQYQHDGSRAHVVGNPAFGRQSSTAIQFIKHSCTFCESVSFILPKSFKKDSLQKAFPLSFHLVFETELPDKSYLIDGKEHHVETVFQIWIKKNSKRAVAPKLEPTLFRFVKKNENPDISFRRVGVNAGTISTDIDKSKQSHYFIKFTNSKLVQENIELLKNIQFDHNNTVGPRSISKQELIKEFIKIF